MYKLFFVSLKSRSTHGLFYFYIYLDRFTQHFSGWIGRESKNIATSPKFMLLLVVPLRSYFFLQWWGAMCLLACYGAQSQEINGGN